MMRRVAMPAARGFTLIEAIVVIVVIGVLSTVVALFIRAPIQAYVDGVGRADMTDEADLALRRMARDLRLALPNSIRNRTSGDVVALEFLMTKAGGRYLSADDGVDGDILDFLRVDAATRTFSVLAAMKSLSDRIAIRDFVVVNNLGPGFEPADAYRFGEAQRNIARVDSFIKVGGIVTSITMADNPFGLQNPPMPSPTQRFHLVSGPVSFVCTPQPGGTATLTRHWGYTITADQGIPPVGGQSAVLATHVASCVDMFQFSEGDALRRSGLVILTLALRGRNQNDPTIQLVHQVHVDNTP
jgi:MSHA biogenesis protein MshO